jgi:Arc/MetJ family transcription regulator
MSRITIKRDGRLPKTAVRVDAVKTVWETLDPGSRRLVGNAMTREEMLAMQGTGWDGDLDEMRSAPLPWDS